MNKFQMRDISDELMVAPRSNDNPFISRWDHFIHSLQHFNPLSNKQKKRIKKIISLEHCLDIY